MALPRTLGADDYKKAVSKGTVIVDFYADWCRPCKHMEPFFEKAAGEYSFSIQFYRVDIEKTRKIADDLRIRSIPTFVAYKDGVVVGQLNGATTYARLCSFIERLQR